MSAVVLGAAWTGLLLAAAWRVRPAPARCRALVAAPEPVRAWAAARAPRLDAVAAMVGARARRLLHRPRDADADLRAGRALLAAAPAALLAPPLGAAVGLGVWAWPLAEARRRRRRSEETVLADLPEVVDLLALAVGAGLTVPLAVAAVAARTSGPVGQELARAAGEIGLGRRAADALDDLPARLGESVRPMVAALTASERYGTPLAGALDGLAVEVRLTRRRRAEERARRLPVKLLFPLVVCVLPAFALLTVAPLLAGALRSLRL
jgi:tight adherence protein C